VYSPFELNWVLLQVWLRGWVPCDGGWGERDGWLERGGRMELGKG